MVLEAGGILAASQVLAVVLVAPLTGTPLGSVPLIDWIALAALLAGLACGAMSGLARSFGMLLWLLAALWLGTHLAAQFVSWMPNSAKANDPAAVLTAFGLIAAVVVLLPILARIIGGAGGKKKEGGEAKHKASGALVGLLAGTLLFCWAAPFAYRYEFLAKGWKDGRAPRAASAIADNVTYLFPEAHREALRNTLGGKSGAADGEAAAAR